MFSKEIREKQDKLRDMILADESLVWAVVESWVKEIPYAELDRHIQDVQMG